MFLENTARNRKENHYFDYQNVNSLCSIVMLVLSYEVQLLASAFLQGVLYIQPDHTPQNAQNTLHSTLRIT